MATTNTNEKDKKKKGLIILLIVIIIALIAALCFMFYKMSNDEPGRTAVIEEVQGENLNPANENGQIRIKINPSVDVKNDTMQNLMFYNLNEGRLLQCKIKVGDNYVYDSGLLEESQVIKGDFCETKDLKKGANEALAEIYSYADEETLIGQTNVKITLNMQ